MGFFVLTALVAIVPPCAGVLVEIPLSGLEGTYAGWEYGQETVTGIRWSSFEDVSIRLEGTYLHGRIQLYHDAFREVDLWTELYAVAEVAGNPPYMWDAWADHVEMRDYGDGRFAITLDFEYGRGYLFTNDPFYSDAIILTIGQNRTIAAGDVIPQKPVLQIDKATLIVPEPCCLAFLVAGTASLIGIRRQHLHIHTIRTSTMITRFTIP
jgi:hypothetical protein